MKNEYNDLHLGFESMLSTEVIELINFDKINLCKTGLVDKCQDSRLDEHELALAA